MPNDKPFDLDFSEFSVSKEISRRIPEESKTNIFIIGKDLADCSPIEFKKWAESVFPFTSVNVDQYESTRDRLLRFNEIVSLNRMTIFSTKEEEMCLN